MIRVGLTNTTGSFPHFVRFWDFSALGARDLGSDITGAGSVMLGTQSSSMEGGCALTNLGRLLNPS